VLLLSAKGGFPAFVGEVYPPVNEAALASFKLKRGKLSSWNLTMTSGFHPGSGIGSPTVPCLCPMINHPVIERAYLLDFLINK